ncbi:MAG TPA: PilZ domain-containing protein [Rectinemataceae bacterium]|nr:PilZ domain-containing protein [Rectinemataceae bacterium]
MILLALLVVLILILLATVLTMTMRGAKRYSWIEYYLKAREGGLSFGEARSLKEAATLAGIPDPTNILWSPRDMDKAIATLLAKLSEEGRDRSREGVVLTDKVYSLRKTLEFAQPRYKYGIRSSRHMAQGQRVRVLLHGMGVFNSTVIDNHQRYLVLSYPAGSRLPKGWVWKGKKVSIYFWRREDAGYVFDSYVIDDLRIRNVPVLQVSHSEALLRTQKRKSVRARSSIPAYLYLLKRIEGAYEKPERSPGLRSVIQDLSEDGVSVAIGGRAVPGLHVKLQFALDSRNIVLSGTVKHVDYDAERNRSVLHVEAVTPSPRTRNAIRSYVYNIRASGDDSDDQGEERERRPDDYPARAVTR